MKERIFLRPLIIEDLPFLSSTGYVSMSEKAKKAMLAASQTRRHTDGNYFEVLTLRAENEIIGFCSLNGLC